MHCLARFLQDLYFFQLSTELYRESYTEYRVSTELYFVFRQIGVAIVGSTSDVAPADRILYKTRDITGTVWCNGLIYG